MPMCEFCEKEFRSERALKLHIPLHGKIVKEKRKLEKMKKKREKMEEKMEEKLAKIQEKIEAKSSEFEEKRKAIKEKGYLGGVILETRKVLEKHSKK